MSGMKFFEYQCSCLLVSPSDQISLCPLVVKCVYGFSTCAISTKPEVSMKRSLVLLHLSCRDHYDKRNREKEAKELCVIQNTKK